MDCYDAKPSENQGAFTGESLGHVQWLLYMYMACAMVVVYVYRVGKFACPRVLDDQKMSEDNQKLRSGCPPDYQIFWGK